MRQACPHALPKLNGEDTAGWKKAKYRHFTHKPRSQYDKKCCDLFLLSPSLLLQSFYAHSGTLGTCGTFAAADCPNPDQTFSWEQSGLIFLPLLSACCPVVVRLLSALKADNKRTTTGQQADNSGTWHMVAPYRTAHDGPPLPTKKRYLLPYQ